MRRVGLIPLICCACSSAPATAPPTDQAPQQTQSPAAHADLTGTVWLSTDSWAAPGTIRIFVPDGTLVMDSCFETYRLTEWRATGDRSVEWQEDTATIHADITELTRETLQLTLRLASGTKLEHYRVASRPYVCPDMPS